MEVLRLEAHGLMKCQHWKTIFANPRPGAQALILYHIIRNLSTCAPPAARGFGYTHQMSAAKTDALQLQPRDLALLRGLFECRIMTAPHVAALFFDGKHPYTIKRLQKLKAPGLIGERTRRGGHAGQ
jgi:hypothetical protein